MEHSLLRLVYPQWQGGDIAGWFDDLSPKEAAQGYVLGAQILALLAESIAPCDTAVVEVASDFALDSAGRRVVQEGIIDKATLVRQTKAALAILESRKPAKILTLGGECAVSVPSFCYLARLYADDVALLWLDAHPDIGLPGDAFYKGYHAMAVSAIIGRGELTQAFGLPAALAPQKVLLVGLHSDEATHYAARQREFGLESLAPEQAEDSRNVLQWLDKVGARKVMIHLDLDVLDPKELYTAVGNTGQMSIEQVSQIIQDVAKKYDVVGLSVAEHLPKVQIKLKRLLQGLPLVKES